MKKENNLGRRVKVGRRQGKTSSGEQAKKGARVGRSWGGSPVSAEDTKQGSLLPAGNPQEDPLQATTTTHPPMQAPLPTKGKENAFLKNGVISSEMHTS